jgi:hypothetical protein
VIETMSGQILQINFKFNMSERDYERALAPLAGDIAATPGLIWKVWLMNEEEGEAGGIYLFRDRASLDAYLDGPIVAGVCAHPALSGFSMTRFEVMEDLTAATRGPVRELAFA